MLLLISTFAGIISTILWYRAAPDDVNYLRVLLALFWGASIMWFVDACVEIYQDGLAYFAPAPITMLHDTFLGLSVVALGLIIWLIILIIKDPNGVVKSAIFKKKK